MHKKFQQMIKEINGVNIDRKEVIVTAIITILSRQNMFILGPAGIGKSKLINNLCQCFSTNGNFIFSLLLSKFTNPDEVFGPVMLSALKQDKYTRKTDGFLPKAVVAFLDEMFKANSAILNNLLTIINERKFRNDETLLDVPLASLFGASNEMPQSDDLSAFYDRFLIRHFLHQLSKQSLRKLVTDADNLNKPITSFITEDELKLAQEQVEKVTISDELKDGMFELYDLLKKEKIIMSDRKWVQSLDALKACAFLDGRTEADKDDIWIFKHICWSEPTQIKLVKKLVTKVECPVKAEINHLRDQAKEAYTLAMEEYANSSDANIISEINTKLKEVSIQISVTMSKQQSEKNQKLCIEASQYIKELNKKAVNKILKLKDMP